MVQATLSVRMDEDIKKRFDTFCADAGMNASVAINMFARAVLREQRIPFEIIGSDDPFYSIKNQARLRESIQQLERGDGVEHELIEINND
ncbi:MAG: type II toxin-antitoxin system RelB/DinJ family antitoxin [Deferribacteraceae bacterium]|jgi:DNA-damage-inducible protein J|nr:type II toxin-antitoxin system RelB/DinJ family antitoxin [Deferribacteraceae bacterium]